MLVIASFLAAQHSTNASYATLRASKCSPGAVQKSKLPSVALLLLLLVPLAPLLLPSVALLLPGVLLLHLVSLSEPKPENLAVGFDNR